MQAIRPKSLWTLVVAVGIARLASLSAYPLMDTTEARYGEVARIMAETGDWIVPRVDYGVPFWGKPPLSFWASALSIQGFGNSEFFLRLPHFLAAVAVLVVTWQFAASLSMARRAADGAVAVNATTAGFLIAAGTVMTDMFLCLAMTLAMAGFWRGWHGERRQVYLMYAGLGIGLLDKGPVILVLAALVLLPWIAVECGPWQMWRQIFLRLRVFSGGLLMLAIAVPWYWLMERSSPGFLQYFFVGEHLQRFVVSGWHGDLYGAGHAHARGTIWIYWLVFAFPWSLLLLGAGLRSVAVKGSLAIADSRIRFLVLWMCSPMLLFTLAGNVLPAYVLPGLPAVGLLLAAIFAAGFAGRGRWLLLVGPLLGVLLFATLGLGLGDRLSDKSLLTPDLDPGLELYYLADRPYSAQYYSGGRARLVESMPQDDRFYLVVDRDTVPGDVARDCELRAENGDRGLYYCERRQRP